MLKILFVIVIVLSVHFEQNIPAGHPIIASIGSTIWAIAFIYLRDYGKATFSKTSTPYYSKFYAQLSADLVSSMWNIVPMVVLALFASNSLLSSNFDIAAAALPFMINSAQQILRCRKLQVADQKLPTGVMLGLMLIIVSAYGMCLWQMIRIAENNFTLLQSTLLQITMISAALYGYFGTNLIRFVLEEKKMEVPPTILDLLTYKHTQGFRSNLIAFADHFNTHVFNHEVKLRPKSKRKTKR